MKRTEAQPRCQNAGETMCQCAGNTMCQCAGQTGNAHTEMRRRNRADAHVTPLGEAEPTGCSAECADGPMQQCKDGPTQQ